MREPPRNGSGLERGSGQQAGLQESGSKLPHSKAALCVNAESGCHLGIPGMDAQARADEFVAGATEVGFAASGAFRLLH
jgi:hypothetical protein